MASNIKTLNNSYCRLKIEVDDMPSSPREDDNFGKMLCWHRRYNLGDEHNYSDPYHFLADIVRESTAEKEIIDFIKSGDSKDMKLEYNRHEQEWELNQYDGQFKKWFNIYSCAPPLKNEISDLCYAITENMCINDLTELAQRHNLVLPLNLYDHSILSMSTSSFIGRAQHAEWDSGQVGWIYASDKAIKDEYGSLTPETKETAKNLLIGEVTDYDYYLRGETYGFTLEQDGVDIDSCWGFRGSFQDVISQMKECVDSEFHPLFDNVNELDEWVENEPEEDYDEDELE